MLFSYSSGHCPLRHAMAIKSQLITLTIEMKLTGIERISQRNIFLADCRMKRGSPFHNFTDYQLGIEPMRL